MPEFGKRVDVPGGRRRAIREEVLLGAAAITIDNSTSVIVEDVCRIGAKLRGRNLPPVGAQLLVKAGAMEILAAVAWMERDQCGITFELLLDDQGVDDLKEEGKWANLLGIDTPPITDRDEQCKPRFQLAY
ncbi:MAG TPA: hypothetical protein VGU01_06655 [Sphingomicrobium sp.]|nr:hypothetical protein [Sphingomicrobium sp.]